MDNKLFLQLARQAVAEDDAIKANNAEIARLQAENVEREATITNLREMVTAEVA